MHGSQFMLQIVPRYRDTNVLRIGRVVVVGVLWVGMCCGRRVSVCGGGRRRKRSVVVCDDIAGAGMEWGAKGDAPKQDRTTDLPLTKRVLYH